MATVVGDSVARGSVFNVVSISRDEVVKETVVSLGVLVDI